MLNAIDIHRGFILRTTNVQVFKNVVVVVVVVVVAVVVL